MIYLNISKIKINLKINDIFKKYPLKDVEIDGIKKSIKKYGFKSENPIVLNQNYEIVKGHHRVQIAKELKMVKVPCIIKQYKDINDMKIDAIRDNIDRRNINTYSQVELRSELGIIEEMRKEANERKRLGGKLKGRVNLPKASKGRISEKIAEQIGSSDKTVRNAIEVIKKADEETKEKLRSDEESIHSVYKEVKYLERKQERAEKIQDAIKEAGRVKVSPKIDKHIHNCDLIDFKPKYKYHLVIADPPWNVSESNSIIMERKGTTNITRDFGKWDYFKNDEEFLNTSNMWLKHLYKLSADDSSIYWFCSVKYLSYFINMMLNIGWKYKNTIVWHKTNPVFDVSTNYLDSLEFIIYATKGSPIFNGKGEHNFYESSIVMGNERIKDKNDDALNLAQKPINLVEKIINCSTVKHQFVLDAFSGTGSVSVVSGKMKRNWDAVELNKKSCKYIRQRLISM